MSKEITSRPEPRSGFEFSKRDKAYHSYMYTLQNRNYGIGIREYARTHNIKRDTLRGWIDRYPGGKPYYDADDLTAAVQAPAKEDCQMVKLSPQQLVQDGTGKEITDIRRDCTSHSFVRIEFYGSVITADCGNISMVLSAIRSISSGQVL